MPYEDALLSRNWYMALLSEKKQYSHRHAEAVPQILSILRNGSVAYVEKDICDLVYNASMTMPDDVTVGEVFDTCPLQCAYIALESFIEVDNAQEEIVIAYGWEPDGDSITLTLFGAYRDIDDGELMPRCSTTKFERRMSLGELKSDNEQQSDSSRYLLSLAAFMGQKITVLEKRRLPRAARRREAANGNHAASDEIVRRVTLRETQSIITPNKDGYAQIEHDFRWMVSGHWRNQWYPSRRANAPLWISGYTKGPEGKPLKAGSTVRIFDVAR